MTILLAVGGNLSARLGPDLFCATASDKPHWSAGAGGTASGDGPDGDEDGDGAPRARRGRRLRTRPMTTPWPIAASLDEDSDPGDDAPDDGVLDPDAMVCASALKVGAVVHEAEVMLTGDGLVLVTIDLVEEHR